jgi:hypothetical protein
MRPTNFPDPLHPLPPFRGPDPTTMDVRYKEHREHEIIEIENDTPSITALQIGGPVAAIPASVGSFRVHPPSIYTKLTNNTEGTIYFSKAEFQVESSKHLHPISAARFLLCTEQS